MEQIKQKIEQFIDHWGYVHGHEMGRAVIDAKEECESELMELLKEVGDNCYSRGIKDFEKWNTTSSYKSELFEKYWQQFKEEMK